VYDHDLDTKPKYTVRLVKYYCSVQTVFGYSLGVSIAITGREGEEEGKALQFYRKPRQSFH